MWQMLKNKHLTVAMLVAPVLAIMAWFAVDYFIGERPHAAKEGAAYTLIAKSNCRYDSGQCDLENSDFKLSIRPISFAAGTIELEMTSEYPLQSAALALVDGADSRPPAPMTSAAGDGLRWSTRISQSQGDNSTIRIAVTAQGATWYAEVPTVFLDTPN